MQGYNRYGRDEFVNIISAFVFANCLWFYFIHGKDRTMTGWLLFSVLMAAHLIKDGKRITLVFIAQASILNFLSFCDSDQWVKTDCAIQQK